MASSFEARSGAKPPSSPTAVDSPRSCSNAFERVVGLGAPSQRLSVRRRADRHDHELLQVDVVVGVRAAVEDVHHRHGQHVGVGAADVAVQRELELVGRRLGRRPATPRGGVGAEADSCCRCRRGRSAPCRRPRWSSASMPKSTSRSRRSRARPPSATPLPPYRSPPSRSSTASYSPVEAPDGTMARPRAPVTSTTSTSTVGLPRESRTSRPTTCSISLIRERLAGRCPPGSLL